MNIKQNNKKTYLISVVLIAAVVFFISFSSICGKVVDGKKEIDKEIITYEINTYYAREFGKDQARLIDEVVRKGASVWKSGFEESLTAIDSESTINLKKSLNINITRILILIVVFILTIVVVSVAARWLADYLQITKYRSDTKKVSIHWWLGRILIVVVSVISNIPILSGTILTYDQNLNNESEISNKKFDDLRMDIKFSDPCEVQSDKGERCLLKYHENSDLAKKLAFHIKNDLHRHGLKNISINSHSNIRINNIQIYLRGSLSFVMNVRHHAERNIDSIIEDLQKALPSSVINVESYEGEVKECSVRYLRNNPLAEKAARDIRHVIEGNGFDPLLEAVSGDMRLNVIDVLLPILSGIPIALYHLPSQDVSELKVSLEQAGASVMLRPSENPSIAKGVLYYPVTDKGVKAISAREKADMFLSIAYQHGFLQDKNTSLWGVPMGNENNKSYEISVVPLGDDPDVEICCDEMFDRKIRPIIIKKIKSDNRKLNMQINKIIINNKTDLGVIYYSNINERKNAERLRAFLIECVGLVNIKISDEVNNRINGLKIWLTYDYNGHFIRFVDKFINALAMGDRNLIRGCYSDQGWNEDRIKEYEYGLSCIKLISNQRDDLIDDWVQCFIRPGAWRLKTVRLQRESVVGNCYSVISTQRIVIADVESTPIKIDSVPEKYIFDQSIPEQFDIVLVGNDPKLRELLKQYDVQLNDGVKPRGAELNSICFPENAGKDGVARIVQAILEEGGFYFTLTHYVSISDKKVYVIAPDD